MSVTFKDLVVSLSQTLRYEWWLRPKWPISQSLYMRYWGKPNQPKKVVLTNRPFANKEGL